MKRFILSLLISVIAVGMFAQKGKVASALNYIDVGNFAKAKEAIDGAVLHEKTADWAKTYFAKGRLAQALYESNDAKLRALYPDPLVVAYDNYLKSIELDEKSSMEKAVILQLPVLSNDFLAWAVEEFEVQNYEKSLLAFEKLIEIQGSEVFGGKVDSVVVFNAGLAAYNAKVYDKAVSYFDKSIELGYDGSDPYLLKYQAYTDTDDLENAELSLIAAFENFSTDQNIVLQLIQFYLANEKDENAYEYIKMAKETDPENFSLFWAEGVLFMKQEKYPEAITALTRSVELNPEFFETQYNLGVCYYNSASLLFEEANDIMDNAKYNEAMEGAKLVFEKAIPFMETAHQLRPDDMDTMISLKELYYRLQYTEKYEAIMAKIKEIEG